MLSGLAAGASTFHIPCAGKTVESGEWRAESGERRVESVPYPCKLVERRIKTEELLIIVR